MNNIFLPKAVQVDGYCHTDGLLPLLYITYDLVCSEFDINIILYD